MEIRKREININWTLRKEVTRRTLEYLPGEYVAISTESIRIEDIVRGRINKKVGGWLRELEKKKKNISSGKFKNTNHRSLSDKHMAEINFFK